MGIDEVGRGTIAGPVVSASVKLSKDLIIGNPMKFNDSKKLSKGKNLWFSLPSYDRFFLPSVIVGYYYHLIDKEIYEFKRKRQK